MNKYTDIFMI